LHGLFEDTPMDSLVQKTNRVTDRTMAASV
jgi:hypothetical protein